MLSGAVSSLAAILALRAPRVSAATSLKRTLSVVVPMSSATDTNPSDFCLFTTRLSRKLSSTLPARPPAIRHSGRTAKLTPAHTPKVP